VRNVCLLPDVPPGAGPGDARALAGRRVLVVENDPGMRQAFTMLLSGWGMDVSDAATVEAARRAARSTDRRLDLVLTDYRLEGGETGLQTIEALRRDLGGRVPALIISAESGESIRRFADPLGVPVLEKPVAETELRRVLGDLLAGVR
jgi:CheY-like chemotaxis protein